MYKYVQVHFICSTNELYPHKYKCLSIISNTINSIAFPPSSDDNLTKIKLIKYNIYHLNNYTYWSHLKYTIYLFFHHVINKFLTSISRHCCTTDNETIKYHANQEIHTKSTELYHFLLCFKLPNCHSFKILLVSFVVFVKL